MNKTWVEIDLGAISRNIQYAKECQPKGTQVIAVIKADAYGHGAVRIAQTALECGCPMVAVACTVEGEKLRRAGITCPILILGGMLPEDMEEAVSLECIPTVFSSEQAYALERAAARRDQRVAAHIKIETGMNRVGVAPGEDLERLLDALMLCPHIEAAAVFTHFSDSDNEDKDFTMLQYQRFKSAMDQFHARGLFPKTHLANSAAALECPEIPADYIRLGIAMYGLEPSDRSQPRLNRALSWHTKVVAVKSVPPGETIGYGRTFRVEAPMRIATIPVGYADGYMRLLSQKGYVLIHGKRVPILGRICMDHFMVDVTSVPDTAVGDPVVLIGAQGENSISAQELADIIGTIHYELVCDINYERIARVYI